MPPIVCFIRHAQAEHNVGSRHYLPDPVLSDHGLRQCKDLRDHLQRNTQFAQNIELIVTSPLRRTLQTTTIALDWLIQRGIPVLPRAEWQENCSLPCDTGSDLAVISQEFPDIDFSSVDPLYPAKSGAYAYTQKAILQRGVDSLTWLRNRPEPYIAVVTHSAFLRTSVVHRRLANADYRVFRFSDEPDSLELVELSGEAGGMSRSPIGLMGIEEGDFEADE